MNKQNVCGNN